ncbi:MAG: glycosyltransferase family protein [Chitinophagaceae bacterium]
MTKILYAIQATGNGHISRATQLMPYLKQFGEVDAFVSGANATLDPPFPVKYRSKGMSLFYGKCGGLDYWSLAKNSNLFRIYKEARDLPVEKYDIVINDFEHITALACKKKKVPSVQFGHQASFMSEATPRPEQNSRLGEMILKQYARATNYIGLHFQPYDSFIFPPVVKDVFLTSTPTNEGHITVYLPAFQQDCLLGYLHAVPDAHFHFFLPTVKEVYRQANITYMPVNNHLFNQSLLSCHGIITGGGFETPAEALHLGKQLMSIPIKGQYEQQCNAAALKQMGVLVLDDVKEDFAIQISRWLDMKHTPIVQEANDIKTTLQFLFETYPSKAETRRLEKDRFAVPERTFI